METRGESPRLTGPHQGHALHWAVQRPDREPSGWPRVPGAPLPLSVSPAATALACLTCYSPGEAGASGQGPPGKPAWLRSGLLPGTAVQVSPAWTPAPRACCRRLPAPATSFALCPFSCPLSSSSLALLSGLQRGTPPCAPSFLGRQGGCWTLSAWVLGGPGRAALSQGSLQIPPSSTAPWPFPGQGGPERTSCKMSRAPVSTRPAPRPPRG